MSVKLAKVHLLRNEHNHPSSSSSTVFKTNNLTTYQPFSQKNATLDESKLQLKYEVNDNPNIHNIFPPQDKNSIKNKDDFSNTNNIDFNDKISLNHSDHYSKILSKLKYIISIFKEDQITLNNIWLKIENSIKQILQEVSKNFQSNENFKRTLHKSSTFCPKYKGKYNTSQDINEYEQENNLLKIKIKQLYKKINEIENKFQAEKLNYLFCIGQYQSTLNSLEEKLKLDSIDKMSKEQLKKLICYPHYIKFDVNEDINPKSIPMYFVKNKIHKSQSSYKIRGGMKHGTLSDTGTLTNSVEISNTIIKNNNLFESLDDIEKIKIVDFDINKNKDIIEDAKKIIEMGKQNFDTQIPVFEKFLGKRKKYFISHPKISYMRLGKDFKLKSWKLNNQLDNLPKAIKKLKTCSKYQKNAIVVFPSSLNETVVNLEKLRIKKNFKNIEYQFEEQQKKNRLNNGFDFYFHANENGE